MKNSKLLLTSLLAAATLSVPAYADIYINFNSEEAARSGDTTAGVVKDGDGEWNNVTNSFANDLALKDILNQSTSATLTYTSANVWAWSTGREGSILNGYLDDGGSGVSITVSDVPYLVYSVNIYGVSDNTNRKLSYKTVNGVNYTKDASGNVVIGTDAWGEAQQAETNTNNTLTVSGLAGDLSISSICPNNGPRGCIAGIQIINTYTGTAYSATLGGDSTWTTTQLGSAAWTNSTAEAGKYANVTLSADAVLTAEAGIVTDGIAVSGGHTLTLSAAEGTTAGIDLIGPGVVRVADGSTLSLANGTILNFKGSNSIIVGAISGAGSLVAKSGSSLNLVGATLTDFTGRLSVESGATLSIGAGSANGATATLADNSVYAITASTTGEVALGNVSGTGTLKFAAVGNTTDSGGHDDAFSTISLGTGFRGTVEITSGVVDMLTDGERSAISSERLGNASKVVLNGGGLLFRNTNNTNSEIETYTEASFSKAIEVGAAGGVIRVYGDGKVTVASDISGAGTLRHTDGGELTLTGTINMTGGFTNAAGTLNISGNATLGVLTLMNNGSALSLKSGSVVSVERFWGSAGSGNSITTAISGVFNVSGNVNSADGSRAAFLMANAGGTNTISIEDGGVLNLANAGVSNRDGTGVLNIKTGGEANFGSGLYVLTNNAGWGGATVNLAGGTLNVGGNPSGVGISTDGKSNVAVNLKSGTLGSLSDSWSTELGFSLEGSLIVDTTKKAISDSGAATATDSGSNVTLNGVLSDATDATGSLTKRGAGTLTLGGHNTFTGGTVIEAGTLVAANASALGAGDVTVADGATLKRGIDGSVIVGGAFTTADGAILDLGTLSEDTAAIAAQGDVTLSAGTIFDVGALANGQVVSSARTLTVADSGTLTKNNFLLNGSALGDRTTFEVLTTGNAVTISNLQNVLELTWAGGGSDTWKANGSGWNVTTSGSAETFQTGDSVTFSDDAPVVKNVVVDGVVSVGTMTIDSDTDFAFSGKNGAAIRSSGALTKIGAGTATIDSTVDLSRIGDGIVVAENGGKLVVDTASGYTGVVTAGANGTFTLNVSSGTTLSNTLSGAGTFEKTGAGTLTVSSGVSAAELTFAVADGGAAITGGTNALKALTVSGEGSTLNISGGTTTTTGMTVGNGGVLNISGGTTTTSGMTVGNGGVLNISGGTTTTTTGMTVGNGGVLEISTGGENSALRRGGLHVLNGGTARFTATDVSGWSGTPANRLGNITIDAGGVLELTANGNETFGGTLTLNGVIKKGTGAAENATPKFLLWGGKAKIVTTEQGARIDASVRFGLKKDDSVIDVQGDTASLEIASVVYKDEVGNGALKKQGTGTLILSGANTYSGGTEIERGVLVAARASALGSGKTKVAADAKLGLVAGTTVRVTNGIDLASGAKIVVDLSSKASATETFTLDLVAGTALRYNEENITSANANILLGALELDGWNQSGWTQSLAYIGGSNTLQLTMTIPEPSMFGLLAGLGALALAGTRRRRKKA